MKNKKKITIAIGTVVILCVCIIICIFILKSSKGYKTTDDLLKGLEKAINGSNINRIEECYPNFIQESLPTLSKELIKEFNNKVGDISFDIIHENNFYSDEILNQEQKQINSEYNCNIKLEGYDLITCKYHKDFCETIFEAIKIKGKWYLYYSGYIPEPIGYFVD